MTEVETAAPAVPAWRYRIGLGLFIAGNVLLVASPTLIPAFGLNAGYVGVGVIVAEIVALSSVFFLGWAGLKQLKDKMFAFLKARPGVPPVDRFRHYLGIFLTFPLSLGLDVLAFVLVLVAYGRTTPEDPFPVVWGLTHGTLGWAVAALFIGGYVSMIGGIFVLGGHWWGRFQALFVWQAPDDTATAP